MHIIEPNVSEIDPGTVLHRVHDQELPGNSFNPCEGGQTRFAPIYDTLGQCISSLYAAETVEASIFETIFHDVPRDSSFKSVPISHVRARGHSVILVLRVLRLASLRAPDLLRWGVSPSALIGSASSQYGLTAQWAKRLHDQNQHLDGLVWTSNRCDPASAYVLFGDRVSETDLQVSAYRDGFDETFVLEVREAASRAKILLTEPL